MPMPITFGGADGLALENGVLRAVVLPAHGGKVVSLRYLPQNFELLFQNPRGAFRPLRGRLLRLRGLRL